MPYSYASKGGSIVITGPCCDTDTHTHCNCCNWCQKRCFCATSKVAEGLYRRSLPWIHWLKVRGRLPLATRVIILSRMILRCWCWRAGSSPWDFAGWAGAGCGAPHMLAPIWWRARYMRHWFTSPGHTCWQHLDRNSSHRAILESCRVSLSSKITISIQFNIQYSRGHETKQDNLSAGLLDWGSSLSEIGTGKGRPSGQCPARLHCSSIHDSRFVEENSTRRRPTSILTSLLTFFFPPHSTRRPERLFNLSIQFNSIRHLFRT